MMFMRHISLCIILQLVHTENCADLKNVEFAGSIINKQCQNLSFLYPELMVIIQTFFIYLFQNAVLRRKKSSSGQGRSESKKKKIFFFLGSSPKIGSVGTWETDNQLDVPLGKSLHQSCSMRWPPYMVSEPVARCLSQICLWHCHGNLGML